jgi:hypothetical protein
MLAMTLLAAAMALFGLGLAWLMLRQDRSRRAWIWAALFAISGLAAGWFIYSTDQRQRAQTLFEIMAEGSAGVKAGEAAPVRQLEFIVEHPGIGHTLMVSPSAYGESSPSGDAELAFRLLDPDGKEIIKDQQVYGVRYPSKGKADWNASYFPFVPTKTGKHRLEVTILTVDVPHIHIRIEDPDNTDGVRIPGF